MPVGVKVKEMARSEFPIVKQVQGNGAATLNPFPLMVPLWDRLTASPQEGLSGDAGGRAQEKTVILYKMVTKSSQQVWEQIQT